MLNSSLRPALFVLMALACACGKRGTEDARPKGGTPGAASATKEAPEQARPFVPATLQSIREGAHPPSTRVAVDVSLVSDTIVRASETNERPRYYMLAVDDASEYAQEAAAIERDVTQLAADVAARLKDKKHKPSAKTIEPLINRLLLLKSRLVTLKVDPKQAIAVELQPEGLARVAFRWNSIINECEGRGCEPRFPLDQASRERFVFNQTSPAPMLGRSALSPPEYDVCTYNAPERVKLQCLANVEAQLARLSAQDPPQLDEEMPKLVEVHMFDGDRVINRYNALVRRYNAEVRRRQQASVAMLPSHVERLLRVSAALKGQKVTVHGVIATLPDIALRTYGKTHGRPPATYVRELGTGEETFAGAFYQKTQYCITSYPPNADISIRGAKVGRTPHCIPNLAVGEPLELEVAWAGYPAVKLDPAKVQALPSGVAEIDCKLHKGEAPGGHCEILQ